MSATFADLDLRALARLEGPERAFLSLYLPADTPLDALRPRLHAIRDLLADQPAELEHFEQNLQLVEQLVGEGGGKTSRFVLACWAMDLAEAYPLGVEVEPSVHVDAVPYLRPLAELQDEYEDFALVVADARAARVYRVHALEEEAAGSVRGDVKNRVKKGGWSQKRYARRRDKQMERYATEVAEMVVDLHRSAPFHRLVLLGQSEARAAVREALPQRIRDLVVGERNIDGDADALKAALELYFEGEREDEQSLWTQIREGYLTGGLAVVGAQRTLEAAQQGRLETAIAIRSGQLKATRCRACEHVVFGTPTTCQRCGSADVFETEYLNALVDAAAQSGAEVDFVDAYDALENVGSVGGLLRY